MPVGQKNYNQKGYVERLVKSERRYFGNKLRKNMPDITIIIPTYNRPKSLERILNYYIKSGEDFHFIVADSSNKKNKEENKKIVGPKQELKVTYLDDYQEDINPWLKFADAAGRVKTTYCLFCGDDDFILPSSIIKAVDFLEKNSDFALAQGRKVIFYKDFSGKIQWKETENCESIEFSDPVARFKKQLADYSMATFSAVHRTDILKIIFAETAKFTNDNRFGELLPSALALIYGKMKCLDIFYGAYEVSSKSTGIVAKSIPEFIAEGSFTEKYNNFRKCLSLYLIKKVGISEENSEKIIDESMADYLSKNYPEGYNVDFPGRVKKFFGRKLEILRKYYINKIFGKLPEIQEDLKNNSEIKNIMMYAQS